MGFGNKTSCGKLPVQLTNRQICQNQMEKQTQEYTERSSGRAILLSDEKQTRGKQLEHLIYRANKKITSSEILCWTKSMNISYYKFKCKEAANLKRTSLSVIAHIMAKKTTHYNTHKINKKHPQTQMSTTVAPCHPVRSDRGAVRSSDCLPHEGSSTTVSDLPRCQSSLNVCVHFLCVHCIMRHQCHQYIGCHWWGLTWLTRPYFLHDISCPVKRRAVLLSVELLKETGLWKS